ncbi:MAG: phosphate acyltransferase PlsX [Elusimicrobiota bacterium]
MKIAVDAMGGDNAPAINIDGSILALKEFNTGQRVSGENLELILIGQKELLKKELALRGVPALPIEIRAATQVIGMEETTQEACRKKPDASILVGTMMLKNGEADAFVSAGNSGAVMAAAVLNLERLKGIRRPAIATVFPTLKEPCVIVDVGANAECKAKHLFQFAIMGESYVKYVFKRRIPRVALLSMGHEEGKGSVLVQSAYKLLMKSNVNFIGNIEGHDIIKGAADVVVCDGFVGNIILKFGESIGVSLMKLLKQELEKSLLRKAAAGVMKGAFYEVNKMINPEETGGAPLLGVNGACIICHGGSTVKAMKNAINTAIEYVDQDVNKHIQESILQNSTGLLRGALHD